MAQAPTKLSNRILIFGPKNFWHASKCNHAAQLHLDVRQKFLGPKIKILLDNLVGARTILTRVF